MKWLRKILGLCVHDYEIINVYNVSYAGRVSQKVFVQKCKHCGKLQNHRVY